MTGINYLKSKRISLAGLFFLVTLAAFACKYVSDLRTGQLRQLAVVSEVRSRSRGDVFYTQPKEDNEWLWDLLGVRGACTITGISARDGILRLEDLRGVMLSEVEHVHLRGSGVRDSWLRQIDSQKLERIVLNDCKITDGGFTALRLNEKMEGIWLTNCPVTNASLRHINNECRSIKGLGLSGTRVDDDGLRFLMNVSVDFLVLSDTSISDNGIEHIGKSQVGVRSLCLDGTDISDVGVEKLLSGCPRLELLQLNRCTHVTAASLNGLLNHPMLRRVELAGTSLQYEDVAKVCGVRRDGIAVSTDDVGLEWQGCVLFKRPAHANTKSILSGGMF